jgi:hypothetical protein
VKRSCISISLAWLLACTPPEEASDRPVETVCAHADWAGLDVSAALHVGEGQAYDRVEAAVSAARAGDVVAIHDGVYVTEPLELDEDGVTLVGRCRDTVVLRSEGEGVRATATDVTVAGLTLEGTFPQGITFSGAAARLLHARVREARGWGVSTAMTDLVVEDVEVVDTRPMDVGSDIALAINITGGRLDATDLLVDGSDGWGVYGNPGFGERIILRRSRVTNLWRYVAVSGSDVTFEGDVEIDHVIGSAIVASTFRSSGSVFIHDVGVDFDPRTSGFVAVVLGQTSVIDPGFRIEATEGAAFLFGGRRHRVEGAAIEGACSLVSTLGAVASTAESLTLTDVTITNSRCAGVETLDGGTTTLERVVIDGARNVGVAVSGGRLILEDVSVRNVRAGSQAEGIGLRAESSSVRADALTVEATGDYGAVFAGSVVAIEDATFASNAGAGVVVLGSDVSATGLSIRDVVPAPRRAWGGFGIYAGQRDGDGDTYAPTHGALRLAIAGGSVEGAVSAGILATDGVPVTLEDVTVSGTSAGSDARGDGVVLASGARLEADGLVTRGNARVGVLFDAATGALRGGTLGEATSLVQQSCASDTAPVTLDGVALAGERLGCGDAPALPVAVTPPVWSDDIRVLE